MNRSSWLQLSNRAESNLSPGQRSSRRWTLLATLATAISAATMAPAASRAADPPAPAKAAQPGASRTGYLRYPDIHGHDVVFYADGDLWLVADTGGMSRRLTTHVGTEHFPKFSPSGREIAFTGEYDGNPDVYVVGVEGGEPRRLTWHPGQDHVIGWTTDGSRVLFRSAREDPHGDWELYSVPALGGEPSKLPLGWAARIDIDPATKNWAFTRISTSETASWKRYRGGSSSDIWVGNPERADFRPVTDFEGPDAFPMWHGGRIYFLSDLGGTANLWSILPDGSDRRRHTDLKDWDARFPSMGPDGRIVFMLAGDIHLFDPAGNRTQKLMIDLPSERVLTRVRYPNPEKHVNWFELAPDGERLLVNTRGELYSVPVEEEGAVLPITRGSGAREKWGYYDRAGKRLAYVSDTGHEERIYTVDAWGRGEPKAVTPARENGGWLFPPMVSPDGKWLAYSDQTQSLYVVPAAGGEPRRVDKSDFYEIRQYAWSPDGRWLAYAKPMQVDFSSIYIYDVRARKSHRVTGPTTADREPAWDPEGRYLYFLGERTMNPVIGFSRDFSNVQLNVVRPYLVLLRKDVKNPFAPLAGLPDDHAGDDKSKDKKEKDKAKKEKEEKAKGTEDASELLEGDLVQVEIDIEGLADRIVELPVDPGILSSPGATAGKLFYLSAPIRGLNDPGEGLGEERKPDQTLMVFDFEEKEATEFVDEVGAYSLAPAVEKVAIMKEKGAIYVVETESPPEELDEAKVKLDGIVVELDPREEWEQMFYEAWRHQRDFYWDAGMAGIDWRAERDRYATLLPRLATRGDLRDVLAEMIGELNTSHTYVWGGDAGVEVPKVTTGLLGADVVREGDFYRVKRIYRGDPADREQSPLREPGVDVREGDYVIAVNHRPFPAGESFLASFAGVAKHPVVLTVNSSASRKGARDVVVTPTPSEEPLRYADWVRQNREYVAEKTGGKMGYIHIPDMGAAGLTEFDTWFYPQLDKEGMVVDAPLERRRLRIAARDRAAAAKADQLRPLARWHRLHVSLSTPERAVRRSHQRVRGLGRRHLPHGVSA